MSIVAHALLRAASRLFSTPKLSGQPPEVAQCHPMRVGAVGLFRMGPRESLSVEKSLDAARKSACATALYGHAMHMGKFATRPQVARRQPR